LGSETRNSGRPPGAVPGPGAAGRSVTVRGGRTKAGTAATAGIGRKKRSRGGGGGGKAANSRGRAGRKNNGGGGGGRNLGPSNIRIGWSTKASSSGGGGGTPKSNIA